MVAWTEMNDAAVWVQTTRPARVRLRYRATSLAPFEFLSNVVETERKRFTDLYQGRLREFSTWRQTPEVALTPEKDLLNTFVLSELPPGTRFQYEVVVNGRPVPATVRQEFQTQPHWRFRQHAPEFSFALGSCSYVNEPPTDRPGNPYGQNHQIYDQIADQRPDFMLWLGDNCYYRENDWLTEAAMRRRWRYERAFTGFRKLLASGAHYAIWDDHDYGPNDSDRSFRLRDAALRVFDAYWPSVVRGTREAPGCFFRFEYGDVEFFMLDDRTYRTPNAALPGPDKVMFGPVQMQWLKDSLADSNATFKVIANGGVMTDPVAYFSEHWVRFADERRDFLEWLGKARIPGVIFVSGDRHATELIRAEVPGLGYSTFEFTSSPLTSGAGRNPAEVDKAIRVPGTWVNTQNFGMIEVKGRRNERKLILRTHDSNGKRLWRHEVSEEQLRPPRAG